MASKKRRNRSRSSRNRSRTDANRVTETGGISASPSSLMAAQDAAQPVPTETTETHNGGQRALESAPQIRPKAVLSRLQVSLDKHLQESLEKREEAAMDTFVGQVIKDATSSETPKERTNSGSLLARLIQIGADTPEPPQTLSPTQIGVSVHGDLNVGAADAIGTDFIELAREFGIESEFFAQIDAAAVESGKATQLPAASEAGRPPAEKRG